MFAGQDATIEFMDDARDVGVSFGVWRNAVVASDRVRAGVIGGQRHCEIIVIAGEERVEVSGPAAHILIWLKTVIDAEACSGRGHKLHQALGSGMADGAGVAVTFGLDNAGEQVDVKVMRGSGTSEHFAQIGGGKPGVGLWSGGRQRSRTRRRFRQLIEGGDFIGSEFDVVVFSGAEINANTARHLRVMVAAKGESVAEC